MEKIKLIAAACCWLLLLLSCGKEAAKPDDPPPPVIREDLVLGPVSLLFPLKDEPCLSTGTSVTQGTVNFKWNAAKNAEGYEIRVKNLLTQELTSKKVAAVLSTEISLPLNAPYSWQVIAGSAKANETSQSETWKFYHSGPGKTTFAPYSAEAVYPLPGQTVVLPDDGILELKWKGSDPDNDITEYFLGIGPGENKVGNIPGIGLKTSIKLELKPATTYYWKVITQDSQNNDTHGDLFSFTTAPR